MSASNNSQASKSPSNLNGHLTAVIILICVVIALVAAVVVEPDLGEPDQTAQIATTVTPSPLGTPLPTEVGAVAPPSVNIDKVIILGGFLVLIVLLAVLREILWYKQKS
ncbi:MAG TPA: hypothetical protein PKH38_04145 [Anaerolineaceae bacterium]|jgi:hypothetical protein|nr:hypothetical protein [Anaerolineaceae bacterium]HOR77911.1 hypothetical protein [Anaerolineaceae bacterium]